MGSNPSAAPSQLKPLLSALSAQKPSKAPKRPATSLPTVRLMLCPKPGLGFDARLPFAKPFRTYLSLESYFNGESSVRIGVESNHIPYIRLEITPSLTLSIRPAPIRLTNFKFGILGASLTMYNQGNVPSLKHSSFSELWQSLSPFIKPAVELQHRHTLLGSFIDDGQRDLLHNAMAELKRRRDNLPENVRKGQNLLMKEFNQDGVPSRDPRTKINAKEMMKDHLKEQIERLKDPSSLYHNSGDHWPGVSRLENFNESGGPQNALKHRLMRSEAPTSVVGHMEMDKSGKLRLVRTNGSAKDSTKVVDSDEFFDMDAGGPFLGIRLRMAAFFSRFRR